MKGHGQKTSSYCCKHESNHSSVQQNETNATAVFHNMIPTEVVWTRIRQNTKDFTRETQTSRVLFVDTHFQLEGSIIQENESHKLPPNKRQQQHLPHHQSCAINSRNQQTIKIKIKSAAASFFFCSLEGIQNKK